MYLSAEFVNNLVAVLNQCPCIPSGDSFGYPELCLDDGARSSD